MNTYECIEKCINKLDSQDVIMHSLLVSRGGELLFEGYYSPISKGSLQRMFSVTKSVVAICVGLLADEGKIKLDDRICQYFPEKVPANIHPFIEELTIRNCLKMRTCHKKATYDKFDLSSDWVGSFFTTAPDHEQDTIFYYDTSAAHVLGALVEKLSDMKLMDYFRFKLPQVGISKEAYVIEGPEGVSMGGTGLMATSEDLMKLGLFVMGKGNVSGVQLLSREYIEACVSNISPTEHVAKFPFESRGYGMQFWRTLHGYCSYGMGGQLILMYPDWDVIVVTTADTQGDKPALQKIFDAIDEMVLAMEGCAENQLPESPSVYSVQAKSLESSLKINALRGESHPCLFAKFTTIDDSFNSISISFDESAGVLEYKLHDKDYSIPFGIGSLKTSNFPVYGSFCAASGAWISDKEFKVYVHLLDTFKSSVTFDFFFEDASATLVMNTTDETDFREYKKILNLVSVPNTP